MIKYNWKALDKNCKKDANLMINILLVLMNFRSPNKKEWLISKKVQKEVPSSFIVNPLKLINQQSYATNSELYIYLLLASKRNLFDYTHYEQEYLPIDHIDTNEIIIDKLKYNKLLKIDDENIYFEY